MLLAFQCFKSCRTACGWQAASSWPSLAQYLVLVDLWSKNRLYIFKFWKGGDEKKHLSDLEEWRVIFIAVTVIMGWLEEAELSLVGIIHTLAC